MNDQYTPIHNEVLEALAKINLAPYEIRVLFVIWRKTYGFIDKKTGLRKKFDWIAGSQITEMTGLDRRLVYRALQGLKKKNVISRDDNKTGFSKEFMRLMSSVEMTNKENVISSDDIGSDKNDDTSDKNDDILSSKLSHTKEKKEIYTKESTLFYKNPEYLLNIPVDDIPMLNKNINANITDVKRKGEEIYNWVMSAKKNRRENYKLVLRNALIKDFGYTYKS